jgi:hypothetical protein
MNVLMKLAFLNNLTYTFSTLFKKELSPFGSGLLIITLGSQGKIQNTFYITKIWHLRINLNTIPIDLNLIPNAVTCFADLAKLQ